MFLFQFSYGFFFFFYLFKKVHSVAWNCIGTKLASGSVDQTARIWHIEPHGHVTLLLIVPSLSGFCFNFLLLNVFSLTIFFSFQLSFCYKLTRFELESIQLFHFMD